MSTVYRYAVYVPSSWQNLGPDAHYAQSWSGFDTHEEAEQAAQELGWTDYIVENYDATDEIAFEAYYEALDAEMEAAS